ncbi:MAG: hypothetical protein DDT30_00582 [Dehalococcoidia bacterium]|nr:hypothetical protein [Bacillota bacterium]MBT9142071.1 hypothetical protein [Bacillota bacterium]
MRSITLDEALAAIHENVSFCAIIEDWDNGLFFHATLPGRELLSILFGLKAKYGAGFRFRYFNELLDVQWATGYGLLLEGPVNEKQLTEILLETDIGRHPGMRAFGNPRDTRILTQVITANEHPVYTRYVKLLTGGE